MSDKNKIVCCSTIYVVSCYYGCKKQLEKNVRGRNMIAKAIIKNGGIFIPNVQSVDQYLNQEVRIEFKILGQRADENIFRKTAGILKRKKIDPLKFQADQRAEWDG
ncbi:MAG: hypothetical protein D3923_13990 [Candidatus Electrothrix sp. AR3]|nr:hypothetical protein [Candidatus Electrothrix sp. AR3]